MYNAKVKCTSVSVLDNRGFTVDKEYQVKDGHFIFENGDRTTITFDSLKDLNECFYATFKEVETS